MRRNYFYFISCFICFCGSVHLNAQIINLQKVGSFTTGIYDQGATEIAAFDPVTNYLYSVNGFSGDVDVLDLSDVTNPTLVFSIDLNIFGTGANSVAVKNGIVAVAVENYDRQANGLAVFFDVNGNYLNSVEIGALPDMINFTPNGQKVLVANEGEPSSDYLNDPLGTVSIIDISGGIATLTQTHVTAIDFTSFDLTILPDGVRVFGPGALPSADFEPEYIAISKNSKFAYVTLQENNAIAVINLITNEVTLSGLGLKDYNLPGNEIDASDKNASVIDIRNWPVYGLYQPDAIEAFNIGATTYLVMANEGDVRDYDGYAEAERVEDLILDTIAFPDSLDLQNENNLGRLNVTTSMGDTDFDGDFDALYSFGGRSFSIRNVDGSLVYDSGNLIETLISSMNPDIFNVSNTNNTKKNRSDDKGPEPEGLTTAKILDSLYLFLGLERVGGTMVFNISNPASPYFVQYVSDRNFAETPGAGTGGDLAPEGMLFIPLTASPNGKNLLVVSNEVSGSIAIYETDNMCGPNKVTICYAGNTYCVKKTQAAAAVSAGIATYGECDGERFAAQDDMEFDINENGILIYPNPADELVTVVYEALPNVYAEFIVTDLTGKLISQNKFAGSETGFVNMELDVASVPSGIYLLTVINGDQTHIQKLIVQ